MKVGDQVESAVWITGDENPDMVAHFKASVEDWIKEFTALKGFIPDNFRWEEKHPMDDRVPQVPDHIQGSRVRLLVCEADLIGETPKMPQGSFIAQLERDDLRKLRKIMRKTYYKYYKKMPTMEETDELIESIGPEAALDAMRNYH